MQFGNQQRRYGAVSITLHWLSALAVIGLFGLGLWMMQLDYYSNWYRSAPDLHKSIGLLLLAATLLRLGWNLLQIKPEIDGLSTANARLAKLGQAALYLLLLSVMFSGYLIATGDARPIVVFGLFELPALPWQLANQADIAGKLHRYAAWSLIILASGHALIALKHHFINRDATLAVMLGKTHR